MSQIFSPPVNTSNEKCPICAYPMRQTNIGKFLCAKYTRKKLSCDLCGFYTLVPNQHEIFLERLIRNRFKVLLK